MLKHKDEIHFERRLLQVLLGGVALWLLSTLALHMVMFAG